jgi:site-specific recombinase XerC
MLRASTGAEADRFKANVVPDRSAGFSSTSARARHLGCGARSFLVRRLQRFQVAGYKLAGDGHDARSVQDYLGHKNIQHTVRYTELSPTKFKDFWRDQRPRSFSTKSETNTCHHLPRIKTF